MLIKNSDAGQSKYEVNRKYCGSKLKLFRETFIELRANISERPVHLMIAVNLGTGRLIPTLKKDEAGTCITHDDRTNDP